MITLEEFKEVFKVLKDFDKAQETLTGILIKENTGFIDFGFPMQVLVIKLLNNIFKVEDPDLFDWWLYENTDKIIYMPDDLKYDLNNIEDLYYYVKEEFDKVKQV